MPVTVWVATANIHLGTGAGRVLAYTPGNVVPASVVTAFGLTGVVQAATINDDGTSPNWRGTDPITRSELDAAVAEALTTAGSTSSTAEGVMLRDAGGVTGVQALFIGQPPLGPEWAVRKDYVDALGTPSNTPDTVVRRASDGGVILGTVYCETPQIDVAYALTRKDYVDALIAALEERIAALESGA